MALTDKRRVFIEEYLATWNATEAARRAGYAFPNVEGSKLLVITSIDEEIKRRIAEKAMTADEVLTRLADHARGDIKDFLAVSNNGDVELDISAAEGKTHLIKKVTQRHSTRTTKDSVTEDVVLTLELHDAQAALVTIGKHHKLFTDRTELTGKDGKDLSMQTHTHIYLPENGRDRDSGTN